MISDVMVGAFQMLVLVCQLLGNATTATGATAAAALTCRCFCVYLSRLMNIFIGWREGTNKLPLAFYVSRNNEMIKGIVRSISTGNQIVYKQERDQKAAPSMKYSSHV